QLNKEGATRFENSLLCYSRRRSMRLKIPNDQVVALREALARAGTSEIGGQIFGEQLAPSHFLASELTFQKRRGTFARFFVDLIQAARDALKFFDRTQHHYV